MTKQILTTTILLLSLFTCAAAQSRTDGFKDSNPGLTFEGLREIGLSVKFAQADGVDAAKRPALLQELRDHAWAKLREGVVPVLPATKEADMVGKPRLVVTITLKKPNDPPPALLIECKFFQRVRLWRDPSQEMEVATWSMGSQAFGSESERIFPYFDKPLEAFVTAYRSANPTSRRSESPAQTKSAAPSKTDGSALKGLGAIDPMISVRFIGSPDPTLNQLSDSLRTETENRLTQAGIMLLRSAKDSAKVGYPLLIVTATLDRANAAGPAIDVRTQLWQRIQPLREAEKYSYLPTWELQANDGPALTEEAVRRIVNSQLDQFIQAYKAANPKTAAP